MAFRLVGTGGWRPGGDVLEAKVSRQSEHAIRDADAVLLVLDAVTGVTEEDARVGEVIRSIARGKVLVVVNKVDDAGREGGRRMFDHAIAKRLRVVLDRERVRIDDREDRVVLTRFGKIPPLPERTENVA